MRRRQSNLSDRSTSIVWASSLLSDDIATHICSRSAEHATKSRDRTRAATTISNHMHRHRHEERVQLKISSRHSETADQRSSVARPDSTALSIMEGLRRRRRKRGARLCRSHAGHRSTKANGSHALDVACVRAHGWHVAGAGEVGQEYGIDAIGRESEWARLQQGMSFSSTNGGLHRWSTGSSRGPATAMPVPGVRGEEGDATDDEAERSATIAPSDVGPGWALAWSSV